MELTKQGHCTYYARYHVVIATKFRKKVLNKGMGEYLKIKIREIRKYYPEIEMLEANVDRDHMHLLLSISPKMSVSHVVNIIKSNTGRALREKFPFLNNAYPAKDGVWSIGYFVSTVGINEAIIRTHIEHQGREDSGQAKLAF